MRVYLDNCCFNRPFDDQSQTRIKLESEAKLHIQKKIIDKEVEMVWSYILEYENDFNPYEERKNAIKSWKDHAAVDMEETDQIVNLAKELLNFKIKSKDALHLACAVKSKCKYFLTTDDVLIKKLRLYKQISVINPLNFITIMEE